MDALLGMISSGPVPAQLSVSFFKVLLVKGRLPQAVDVGFDPDVVEVPQLRVDQSSEGELSVEPVKVALT